jgi:hypothetical protein
MKKYKGHASSIKREMPATPSPEKLPRKRQQLLPSPPTTRNLRRKGTPTWCTFGPHRGALYPGIFYVMIAASGISITVTM